MVKTVTREESDLNMLLTLDYSHMTERQLQGVIFRLTTELQRAEQQLKEARTQYVRTFEEFDSNVDLLCAHLNHYDALTELYRAEVMRIHTRLEELKERRRQLVAEYRQRKFVQRFLRHFQRRDVSTL